MALLPVDFQALFVKILTVSVSFSAAVQPLVDRRDLLHPSAPLRVLQAEDVVQRPVEVKSHEGYLLVERGEGVA
jgi:hypothetical protein